ncbi:MAG: hypothetical protein H6558_20925 [Lewinellaceae bacterium]|nr:hypothetical protein [Lewinellaceae bacterium]MCB9288088.1 hypothetical protein [Lewinellaceae bacterium]
MEKFIIELKDLSKRTFLIELLAQLDFIDVKIRKDEEENPAGEEDYDFFQSAGLFANRDIDANQLRKEAWRIPN